MQLLQKKNVCNFIVLKVCPSELSFLVLLLQRYYCYIFVISYCMSKNYNPVYLIDTDMWHELNRLKYFIQGNWQNTRVLLYTFCTEYHFKQIKCQTSLFLKLENDLFVFIDTCPALNNNKKTLKHCWYRPPVFGFIFQQLQSKSLNRCTDHVCFFFSGQYRFFYFFCSFYFLVFRSDLLIADLRRRKCCAEASLIELRILMATENWKNYKIMPV